MTISGAVRELRRTYRETQPAFAERLGLSARAVSSYESKTRKPDARSLLRLEMAAHTVGRDDLQALFSKAFSGAEIYSELTEAVRSEVANLLVLKKGDSWLLEELTKLIKHAKVDNDAKLGYMEFLLDKAIALLEDATKKLTAAQKKLHEEANKKISDEPVAAAVPVIEGKNRHYDLEEEE